MADAVPGYAAMFKALGDPTRLRIFEFLRGCCSEVAVDEAGEVRRVTGPTAGEVCCRVTGVERVSSTVSFHLKELRLAGLITVERRGKNMVCAVRPEAVAALGAYFAAVPGVVGPEKGREMEGTKLTDRADVRELVRERYGKAALVVLEGRGASCCGSGGGAAARSGGSCCDGETGGDPISGGLYSGAEAAEIPEAALLASLGCGNPTALASLEAGEVVLDLGSGGGIDVLLSAKRVGPAGFAYGLDMTDEMLELAERNRADAGVENVRFLKGQIEEIPLPDESVDVIISNCVINLSGDKDRVLAEAFRVLRPGGRFAVSDIVWRRPVPEALRGLSALWAGCISGALLEEEYRARLEAAGFGAVTVTPTRIYTREDARQALSNENCTCEETEAILEQADEALMSAFVRAVKPAG